MIRLASKISRNATRHSRTANLGPSVWKPLNRPTYSSDPNSVALQMINYALSHARSNKTDDSYGQSQIVLEQCLETQSGDDSRAFVFMAMSTLSSERGNFDEALEKLKVIQGLEISSVGVKVAAMEALVGLYLELGKDDTSSVVADKCIEMLQESESEFCGNGGDALHPRAKAIKGLVELVLGNVQSAESIFQLPRDIKEYVGGVALSYGELLHVTQKFSLAKELYQSIIQQLSEMEDLHNSYSLGACNMSTEEVLLAATCALGQIEAQFGNFGEAEVILTRALTKTEEHFGSHHPKVGVVLTCIANMLRQKSMEERSSSLLIQEGLYRKAIELLKAPPLESAGEEAKVGRNDIVALARGGYAEGLCVQQNRKEEGERMKRWAEAAWKNRRISLVEALDISKPHSKTLIIDTRISRAL